MLLYGVFISSLLKKITCLADWTERDFVSDNHARLYWHTFSALDLHADTLCVFEVVDQLDDLGFVGLNFALHCKRTRADLKLPVKNTPCENGPLK
jgi:hypothetical protein